MIAGNAISPLLKMNGEEAMAIACAAFCIPTSITIVRLTALPKPPRRDRAELHAIANRMSSAAARTACHQHKTHKINRREIQCPCHTECYNRKQDKLP